MMKLNQVDFGQYLFERSTEALLLYHPKDGRIIGANPACERLVGRAQWELKGDLVSNLITCGDEMKSFETALRRMELHADRGDYMLSSGDIMLELSTCPIPMDDQIIALMTLTDVSESSDLLDIEINNESVLESNILTTAQLRNVEKERSETLGNGEERPKSVSTLTSFKYRELVEGFHELVWVTDLNGQIEYLNESARRIFGYDLDEMIGREFRDFQTPEQAGVDYTTWQKVSKSESPITFDTRYLRKDGIPVELRMTAFVTRAIDGSITGFSGTATDISARRLAEQRLQERERWFRAIFDTDPHCVMLLDSNGLILDINTAGVNVLAADSVHELRGTIIFEQLAENCETEYRQALENVFKGDTTKFEYELLDLNGNQHWMQTNQVPLWTANGNISAALAVSQDVTEQRLALEFQAGQNRVLESVARGKPLQETLTVLAEAIEGQIDGVRCSILLLDETGTELRHGAAPSLHDDYNTVVDGLAIGEGVGSCGTAAFTNQCVIVENVMEHEYWKPFRELAQQFGIGACWSVPINTPDRRVLGTFAMYYATERHPEPSEMELISLSANLAGIAIEDANTQRILKQSEERFRNVFNESPDAIFVESYDGRVIDLNPAACNLHKMTREEIKAANVADLVPDFLQEKVTEDFKLLVSGEVDVIDSYSLNSDGVAIPVQIRTTRITHDAQPALLLHVRDMTAHHAAQEQLREAEARFRGLFEHSPDAIMVETTEGDVLDANRAACELHAMTREELLDCTIFELVPERLRAKVLEDLPRIASGELDQFERFSLRSDGTEVPVSIRVNRIQYGGEECLIVLARDISERVKAEEASVRHQAQLAHFSRLRIMGELVAGIAHEVSQPLYAITNFASACHSMTQTPESMEIDQLNEWTEKNQRSSKASWRHHSKDARVCQESRSTTINTSTGSACTRLCRFRNCGSSRRPN